MNKPISEETIHQVLQKVDLVDLIGEYVQLKKTGKNYVGLCPFHAEKSPSFSVSSEKQFYHCFGCGAGGNAFSFLMEVEGYTFPQAVYELAQKVGIHVETIPSVINTQDKQGHAEKEAISKAHNLVAQLFHHVLLERNEGNPARDYLEKRGFQLETIKEFQIGYAPDSWDFLTRFLEKRQFSLPLMEKGSLLAKSEERLRYYDRFRGRLMFPIWDIQGKVIAFGGRVLDQGHPKYLNSAESIIFQKSRQLFNFHRARSEIRKQKKAILFEGYIDAISAWQAGIRNGLATLGTALSEEQARIIRRHAEEVIICYDGDESGIEASLRAAEILEQQGCLIKVAVLPSAMDPDEYIRSYGSEAFQNDVLAQARALTAFRLEMLRKGRNLLDDGDKLTFIHEALRLISKLGRAVEREHYLRQLAHEFSLSLEALKQEQYHIYKEEKKNRNGDKPSEKWNNSINSSKHLVAHQLLPAFHNAERILLAHMLRSAEVTRKIQELIGSTFNIDEHCALAAHVYAFYAKDQPADLALLLTYIDDPALSKLAMELSMLTISPELTDAELRDYMFEILSYPYQVLIAKKQEEKQKVERQGDAVLAAQMAMEILQMKHNLKKPQISCLYALGRREQ